MSVFTPAISCLITSNLPLFINLTFQVSVQYFSLQYHILLSVPNTSTTGCHFHFDSASSFFLELFLYSFPVAYWTPTDLGVLILKFHIFFPFILFMQFSRQEYWSGLPFLSQYKPRQCIKKQRSHFVFVFVFFYFTILYWFCHTSTWIQHRCTRVPNPEPPPTSPTHTPSLRVIPVHQPQASSTLHRT